MLDLTHWAFSLMEFHILVSSVSSIIRLLLLCDIASVAVTLKAILCALSVLYQWLHYCWQFVRG